MQNLHHYRIKSLLLCILLLMQTFLFASCVNIGNRTANDGTYSKVFYFFDTFVTVTFYDEKDKVYFEDIEKYCAEYDYLFNRHLEGSDVWNINHSHGEPVTVSYITADLIIEANAFSTLSNGAVDITVAPLLDLWDFTSEEENHMPPSDEDIRAALEHVDYRKVKVKDNTVTLLDEEMAIDLGFIAKGYIADMLKEYLVSMNVQRAIINLGGNIVVIGKKPDGSNYNVGVKKPFSKDDTSICTVELSDTSIVTSGIYERCFTYNDKLYHHILDPKTGYPVENNLYQVSVVCEESTKADGLSTTLLILGEEKGMKFLEDYFPNAHALFIDNQLKISGSAGFSGN